MKACPKCGYERSEADEKYGVVPSSYCPKCGIIYEKFVAQSDIEETVEDKGELPGTQSVDYNRLKNLGLNAILVIVSLLIIIAFFYKKDDDKKTKSVNEITKQNMPLTLSEERLEKTQGESVAIPPREGRTDFSWPSSTANQPQTESMIRRVMSSVVVIYTYNDREQQVGGGSGFFISGDGNVVTNHHVFRGATTAKIKTYDGNLYFVRYILAEDVENDLVMFSTGIPSTNPLPVSSSPPEVGEKVIAVGNPLMYEHTVSDGIVSAVRGDKYIQITAPISHGSSGGPVVNEQGEVIGVAAGTIQGGQNINICIAGKKVAQLSAGPGYPVSGMVRTQSPAEKQQEIARNEIKRQQEEINRARDTMISDLNRLAYDAHVEIEYRNYHEAFVLYKRCLDICRRLNDVQCMSTMLRNIGVALEYAGRYDEANNYFYQASEILKRR